MKTLKFKLYASKRNKTLHTKIEISGLIYNYLISIHKLYYRLYKKYPSKYDLMKHVTKLKRRPEFKYWKEVNSQAIQDIVERIDFGYKKFFRKENKRPPTFRKLRKFKSFKLKQTGYKFHGNNKVTIQGKEYKYFKSREIGGNVKTVVVKRDTLGDIFLFITTGIGIESERYSTTSRTAGFDFGLKTFLVGSDSTEIESPLFYKQVLQSKRELSRRLSRKKKGSNNRRKARINLARLDKTTVNRRRDWMFKLARKLCYKYSVISLETLSLKSMIEKWGRKVLDLALAEFIQILKYIATKFSTKLIFVDKWFPSTKKCSSCGYLNQDLGLGDREWICPSCNTSHNRDVNAAININREGTSSLKVGDVRLPLEAVSV